MRNKLQTILFLAMFLFGINSLNAQVLQFVFVDSLASGTSAETDIISSKAEIRNTTFANIQVWSKMEFVQKTEGHEIVYCWDVCYPPKDNDWASQSPVVISAGGTSGSIYHADLVQNGIDGVTIARFTFWVDGNPSESISYNATFTVGPAGVTEKIDFNDINIYPNPVINNLKIDLKNITANNIIIFNQYGQELHPSNVEFLGNIVNVPTDELSNGSYVAALIIDGRVISRKKFIVLR